jgi:hypothetical protein
MKLDTMTQIFKEIISLLSWIQWLGLVVVLFLMIILGYLIWKRKYSNKDSNSVIPEVIVPSKLKFPSNTLLNVWLQFKNAIPFMLRAEALGHPFSIVIGDAGSGKTAIIDNHAEWEGQDYRFYSSSTKDALLQVYLGAKALVLELSSSILYDTSTDVYHALKKLWGHLPPTPQVVMVIDATALLTPQADHLREMGQALFGKFNAFEELEKEPLPLILAISHMEAVPGFIEFCLFLKENGIPLNIEFTEGDDSLAQLKSCLDVYHEHLPRALVTCSSQDYLRIVAFLNAAPQLFNVLIDFLQVAGFEKGDYSPDLARLCLLSNQVSSYESHPFAPIEIDETERFSISSYWKKMNINCKSALALYVAGSIYLISSYINQQSAQLEIYSAIANISSTPIEFYNEKLAASFKGSLRGITINGRKDDLNKEHLMVWKPFRPTFFKNADMENRANFIDQVRRYYLIPRLKDLQLLPDASFTTTRFLGILYATSDNEMGEIALALREKPIDPKVVNIYTTLLEDYISYNVNPELLTPLINGISFTPADNLIKDHTKWLMLFHKFQEILKKPYIKPAELASLQREIEPMFRVIEKYGFWSDDAIITNWLSTHTNLLLTVVGNNSDAQLQQKQIAELLSLVKQFTLSDNENCSGVSLNSCLSLLQAISNAKSPSQSVDLTFSLDGENFSFTLEDWLDLLKRSRLTLILNGFIQGHHFNSSQGMVFFDQPSTYNDIYLNPYNDGEQLYSGKARIDGRYTKSAFDKDVKTAITSLPDILNKLPIGNTEKRYFSDFVDHNLRVYADNYVHSYWNYFSQLQVTLPTSWSLNTLLDDIQEPSSVLLDALLTVKTNTSLDLKGSSKILDSFSQQLSKFGSIQQIMTEKSGGFPEYEKYQKLMSQLQNDLNSTEAYVPVKTDENAVFKGALTPIGRVAWAIQMNDDSSYLQAMKGWLQNYNVPPVFQQPFLEPVKRARQFGIAEINRNINAIWTDIWGSNVSPLLDQFPFSINAGLDKEVTQDSIYRIFHPTKGIFWNAYKQYLAPISEYSNGMWTIRPELYDSLNMPKNFLNRLNAIQNLTSTLWNEEGVQKPLAFKVKSGLLPTFNSKQIPNAPIVSLSYLREGSASALGFNQMPTWQTMKLEWWAKTDAQVGMEFLKDKNPVRAFTDITFSDSNWNLFRLLRDGLYKGNIADRNHPYITFRWPLAHPDFPQQPLNIEFIFEKSPAFVFQNLARK